MRFKTLLLSLFLVMGCSGEGKKASRNVDVKLNGSTGECLKELNVKIEAFLQSRLSEAEIGEIWACLDGALVDFVSITSPEHPNGYPPEALARFFESFFLKREVPASVAKALMNVKRIFIGGEKEFLTKEEVTRLQDFIGKAQVWSLRLNPHLQSILLNDQAHVSLESMDLAFRTLDQVMLEIGVWFQDQNQLFTQSEIKELLVSLQEWLDPRKDKRIVDELIDSLPLLFDLKQILVGGDQRKIRSEEWPAFLRKSSSVLHTVRLLYFKKDTPNLASFIHDPSFSHILGAVSSVFGGVDIEVERLQQLIRSAAKKSWWPRGVKPSGVNQALEYFITQILGVPRVDHHFVEKVLALKRTYDTALAGQNVGFQIFSNQIGPIHSNQDGFIYFEKINAPPEWSTRTHTLAFFYTLVGQVFEGYRVDELTEDDFERILREVLNVLKALDVDFDFSSSMASKIFREMGVFTLVSDGDFLISRNELTNYIWMVWSAFHQSEQINKTAPRDCRSSECKHQNFKNSFAKNLRNFPILRNYLMQESEEDRERFFELAKQACGDDSVLMNLMILTYLEFYMLRYDDGDSLLSTEEVVGSFEVFGPVLEKLLGEANVPKEDTLAFFTYLFRYGTTPLDSEFYGAWLRYLHWKLFPGEWDVSAHRTRLLQILAELSKL